MHEMSLMIRTFTALRVRSRHIQNLKRDKAFTAYTLSRLALFVRCTTKDDFRNLEPVEDTRFTNSKVPRTRRRETRTAPLGCLTELGRKSATHLFNGAECRERRTPIALAYVLARRKENRSDQARERPRRCGMWGAYKRAPTTHRGSLLVALES